MIIYKYVDADTLIRILDSQRIMFTHCADFNDPFDRPRVARSAYDFEYIDVFTGDIVTPAQQVDAANEAWEKCSVSSFTRTYDNALMWAHYADKHRGAVIAIDAELAALTSKHFLIPAQFGSVIYMKRPMPEASLGRGLEAIRARQIERGESRFQIENYEGLQRLFLTKALPWSYEEEVRVVANPFIYAWDENDETFSGNWKRITKRDNSIGYGWRIPPSAIRRVYTGIRFTRLHDLQSRSDQMGFWICGADREIDDGYEVHFKLIHQPKSV